jgi:hypothetical protein
MNLVHPIRRCRRWFADDCRDGAWLARLPDAARATALVASVLHPDVSGRQTQRPAGATDAQNK